MKQKVKEAAYTKQSPWIIVDERLLEDISECLILLLNGVIGIGRYEKESKSWIMNGFGIVDDVILYMPIPSFDEILEANKDVLQRLKEK